MAEFTGIFLPAEILALEDLNLTEKVVLCQIIPLALERPCTAENKTIAKRLGISDTAVSLNIKSLDAKGYIDVDTKKNEGFKREVNLYFENDTLFKIINKPSLKILNSPIEKSYIAYLKNLKTLFKNIKEPTKNFKRASLKILNSPINRYESKDESIVESKEENTTTTTSAGDFFENEIAEEDFSEKELAAMEEANAVPAFVAIAQQQAAEIAKNQITQESLRAELLKNETCKVAAKNGKVKAEDYAEAVQKFINDKFGLGENTKWTGTTDALKHFCFWVPSFNRIKNQEHGRTRTVLHTGKTTGRHIVEQRGEDTTRLEIDADGTEYRVSAKGKKTFAG